MVDGLPHAEQLQKLLQTRNTVDCHKGDTYGCPSRGGSFPCCTHHHAKSQTSSVAAQNSFNTAQSACRGIELHFRQATGNVQRFFRAPVIVYDLPLYRRSFQTNVQQSFKCEACGVECADARMYGDHLRGKRHK